MKDKQIIKLINYKSCTSTNDELYILAKSGAPKGTVVTSDSQTKGKGTNGRSFFSPEKTGIYMSVLLRDISNEQALDITMLAAVTVKKTLDILCGVNTKIKPVNDIFIDGKKVCGILTKAHTSGKSIDFVIVGIGINLFCPENGFPDALSDSAGYVVNRFSQKLKNEIIIKISESLLENSERLSDKTFRKQLYEFYNINLIEL